MFHLRDTEAVSKTTTTVNQLTMILDQASSESSMRAVVQEQLSVEATTKEEIRTTAIIIQTSSEL